MAKDKVEDALKVTICNRAMTLQEAQHIISTDWFKYYRDHIEAGTTPVSGSAGARARRMVAHVCGPRMPSTSNWCGESNGTMTFNETGALGAADSRS
jgi:hypothetical protein